MALLDWLTGSDRSLQDVSLEEVKEEKRRLNIREGKALKRMEKLESAREEIFEKGANVSSDIRRRQLARKYKQANRRLERVERELNRYSKQLVTLSAINLALERREHMKEGLLGLLSDVSEEEIKELLEDDKISYDMYMDRLDSMLQESAIISDEEFLEEIGEEGQEVIQAWEAMDEGEYTSMEEAMESVEEEMEEEPEEMDELTREKFEEA